MIRTVNDAPPPAADLPPSPSNTPVDERPAPAPSAERGPGTAWMVGAGVVGALSVAALTLALLAQQRVKTLEQELVRRQQESQGQSAEARAMARQALESAQSSEAKLALVEGKVAETALQRTQLEELIQQLSRSRDENALADIDAAIRVAVQQSAITGGAEPLAAALRQAEERLSRLNQPRLERVRRAVARDLDRVRATAVTDIASLNIRLDEAIRAVDELPLLAQIERRPTAAPAARAPAAGAASAARAPASGASAPAGPRGSPIQRGWQHLAEAWDVASERVWQEVRGLVRVTQIDNPEAVLIAPEQAWFLRENLKLRLLNARLALLSRQFDTAQGDLRDAQAALDRYFDRSVRRVLLTGELVRQVAGQARQLSLPRPEETLAALAAAQAGR